MKKNWGEFFNLIICITAIFFLLMYPAYCIEAAKDGLSTAMYIVLPSIFPFMVLSRFIISSEVYYSASEFIGKPFEVLFGIPKRYAFVLILGCLGGFPVGAIILSNLLKQKEISVKQTEHLVGICNNASPVFVIGTVGTLLLNNTHYGYVLHLVHIFCTILCGMIMKYIFHSEHSYNELHIKKAKNFSPFSRAVTDSGINMLNIASYIIIFSVVSKFVLMILKNNICTFVLCILEITTGIKHCASGNMPEILKLSVISFTLGFSGLCVFSQIKSVFGDIKISFSKYFFAKSLTAILSFITTHLIFTIIFSH